MTFSIPFNPTLSAEKTGVGKGYKDSVCAYPIVLSKDNPSEGFAEIPSGAVYLGVCLCDQTLHVVAEVDSEQLPDIVNFEVYQFTQIMPKLKYGQRTFVGYCAFGSLPQQQIALFQKTA